MQAIYAITFLRSLLWNGIYFFLPLVLIDRGVTGPWRGVLLGTLPAGGILFSLFAGLVSDRAAPRQVIAVGLGLSSVFFLALGGFSDPWILLPAFLLGGLGMQLTFIASDAYVYKGVKPGREGRGLGGLLAVGILAMSVGLVVGGRAIEHQNARAVLLVGGVAYALLAVGGLVALPRVEAMRLPGGSYTRDLAQPRVRWLLAIAVLTRLHWGAELTSYTPFLREAYGLGQGAAGLYMAGPILLLGIASYLGGVGLDRGWKTLPMIGWGALASGIGQVAFTLPGDVYGSVAWRVVHEVGEAVLLVAIMREVAALVPRSRSGGAVGVFALFGAIATGLGAVGSSTLGDAFHHALPNQIGGLLMIVAAPLVLAPALRATPRLAAT